jgi:hypothetical protein
MREGFFHPKIAHGTAEAHGAMGGDIEVHSEIVANLTGKKVQFSIICAIKYDSNITKLHNSGHCFLWRHKI